MKQKLSKTFRRWLGRLFDLRKPEDLSEDEVLKILRKLDKTDPAKRKETCVDKLFIRLIPVLHKHDKALDFLNVYGHVSNTYFAHLRGAATNLELQRQFCKVIYNEYGERYHLRYPNLLCHYLALWDLMPEIKAEIYTDTKCRERAELLARHEALKKH